MAAQNPVNTENKITSENKKTSDIVTSDKLPRVLRNNMLSFLNAKDCAAFSNASQIGLPLLISIDILFIELIIYLLEIICVINSRAVIIGIPDDINKLNVSHILAITLFKYIFDIIGTLNIRKCNIFLSTNKII